MPPPAGATSAPTPTSSRSIGDPLGTEEFGFIFTPGSDLVAPFNAAIETMKDDGFLDHLNTRWFFLYDPTRAITIPPRADHQLPSNAGRGQKSFGLPGECNILHTEQREVPVSAGPSQANSSSDSLAPVRSHLIPVSDRLSRLPYWLLVALLIAVLAFWTIVNNENYRIIFAAVRKGVWTTIYVSVIAYSLALWWGWSGA